MSNLTAEARLTPPPDSLAAAVMRAEDSSKALRDVPQLMEAARSLVDAMSRIGCYDLVAASRSAEPLATAAAIVSAGVVNLRDVVHCSAEKVMMIDAATITGDATRACANSLRERGALWVGAFIYDRVRPDLDMLECEQSLDFVAALP